MWLYKVEPPTAISFSGGRTSAYLLRQVLDAHAGRLPPGVSVIFANTGKERVETLDFVRECGLRWDVEIRWVEFIPEQPRFREVTYETASRNGEPFEALVRWKQCLPNPVQRLCTQHLKIETMKRFIVQVLGFKEWTTLVGIRFDEPRRWRIVGQDSRNPREFKEAPLIDARVTTAEVMAFWAEQPFDLGLDQGEGNCDCCFLKGVKKNVELMRKRPQDAEWWIKIEAMGMGKTPGGGKFTSASRPDYAEMLRRSKVALPMVSASADEEDALPCACHD